MLQDLPLPYLALLVFVFGLMIGSFLNVVIYRLPLGKSIVYPGSHCPKCNNPVKPRDNVPVLSYLILRGRCRFCKIKISPIYPIVEFMVGLLFLSLLLIKGPVTSTLTDIAFAASIVALIFIDAGHQILPNAIVYPGLVLAMATRALLPNLDGVFWSKVSLSETNAAYVAGAIVALSAPLLLGFDFADWKLMGHKFVDEDEKDDDVADQKSYLFPATIVLGVVMGVVVMILGLKHRLPPDAVDSLIGAIAGAIVGAGFFWLMRVGYYIAKGREGMGLGDAKMMAFVGAYFGWRLVFFTTFVGALLGSVIGVIYLRMSNKSNREPLPFGVFLGAASLIALFAGHEIISWWVGTFR